MLKLPPCLTIASQPARGLQSRQRGALAPLSTLSVCVTWHALLDWVDELIYAQFHCRMSCQQVRHDTSEGEDEFKWTRCHLAGRVCLV